VMVRRERRTKRKRVARSSNPLAHCTAGCGRSRERLSDAGPEKNRCLLFKFFSFVWHGAYPLVQLFKGPSESGYDIFLMVMHGDF